MELYKSHRINRPLGRMAGDRVLDIVACSLIDCVRMTDTFCRSIWPDNGETTEPVMKHADGASA